jgi:LPLT family lysophospholipid transporter-like MFS transporter
MTGKPHSPTDLPLLSLPMGAVLLAQYFSAFGDNALLITAIALVKSEGHPGWIPLLQACFVIPFILLAPFVGALADAFPKGRVMLFANGLKLAGAAALAAGLNPLVCYGAAGVGAAAYSPAKYGILSQLFGPEKLVKANGMLEGSTIVAILLGVVVVGWLADLSLAHAFAGVMGMYALAAAINLLIPRLPPEHPLDRFDAAGLLREFIVSVKSLWRNNDARFSLIGTSLFWGTGSTLRLALFAWVPVALGIANNQMPANLMGVVSIGIVLGAALAGLLVRLETVNRALRAACCWGPWSCCWLGRTAWCPPPCCSPASAWRAASSWCPSTPCCRNAATKAWAPAMPWRCRTCGKTWPCWVFVGVYALAEGLPVVGVVTAFGAVVMAGVAILAWRPPGRESGRRRA